MANAGIIYDVKPLYQILEAQVRQIVYNACPTDHPRQCTISRIVEYWILQLIWDCDHILTETPPQVPAHAEKIIAQLAQHTHPTYVSMLFSLVPVPVPLQDVEFSKAYFKHGDLVFEIPSHLLRTKSPQPCTTSYPFPR